MSTRETKTITATGHQKRHIEEFLQKVVGQLVYTEEEKGGALFPRKFLGVTMVNGEIKAILGCEVDCDENDLDELYRYVFVSDMDEIKWTKP